MRSLRVVIAFLCLGFAAAQVSRWTSLDPSSGSVPSSGTSSFASSVCNDRFLYTFGGFFKLTFGNDTNELWRFDLDSLVWTQITPQPDQLWPAPRTGSSMVCYNDVLYIFGGEKMGRIVRESTNEHWSFNTTSNQWTQLKPSKWDVQYPPAMSKHSFHLDHERGTFFVLPQYLSNELSMYAYEIQRGQWYRAFSIPVLTMYDLVNIGFITTLPGTNTLAFSYSMQSTYYHVLYDFDTGSYEIRNMNLDNAMLLTGPTTMVIAHAYNASLVIIQTSTPPTSYESAQSNEARWGTTLAWDVIENRITSFDKFPNLWLAMVPAVSYRRSKHDLIALGSEFLKSELFVSRLDFSLPCPRCDLSTGSCVGGIYCKCNDPTSAVGNCSLHCDDCSPRGVCFATSPVWADPNLPIPKCICRLGYIGDKCNEKFECVHGYLTAVNYSDPLGPQICKCSGPFQGDQCQNTCVKGFSCFGDATCSSDAVCQCPGHFAGPHCEYDLALPEIYPLSCRYTPSAFSTTDLTGLTWCAGENPTVSPLRLPPPADPKSIAFDVRPCADELNPNATCKTVVKVSSLGWSQSGNPYSFVLSGMQDGHFIIASFTNDSIAGRFRLGDRPVNHIVGSLCRAGGLVMAADNDSFLVMLLFANGTTFTVASGHSLAGEGYSISQIDLIAFDSGAMSLVYPLVLLQKTDPKVAGPQWLLNLREYEFNSTAPNPESKLRNAIFWRIKSPVVGNLHFDLAPQPEGFEFFPGSAIVNLNVLRPVCSSWNSARPSRIIAKLGDAEKVSIIGLPSFPLAGFGSFFDQYDLDLNRTVVFRAASNEIIVKSDLYPECFSVPTASSSAMIVAATLKSINSQAGNISIVRLDEFAKHSAYCSPAAPPSNLLRNLLFYRNSDGTCQEVVISQCPIGTYYDGLNCVSRVNISIPLGFSPSDSYVRFIGPPMGKLNPDDLMNSHESRTWNTSVSGMMRSFMYHAFFVLDDSRQMLDIWAVQQDIRNITEYKSITSHFNKFHTSSPVESWHVTDNGQHILVASNRKKWELDAQERLVEICHEREINSTAAKLYEPFAKLCKTPFGAPKPVSYSDFVYMLSMCSRDTYCPLFSDIPRSFVTAVFARQAPGGSYAIAPGLLKSCEKGYFCRNGQRSICPRGFICPDQRMTTPVRCETVLGLNNRTCFDEGLTEIQPCPSGFVCLGVDVPPVPAPPGHYISAVDPQGPGVVCPDNGTFCPLAAGDPAPKCPPGFACRTSSGIYPTICITEFDANGTKINNGTSYCPEGTSVSQLCPAGFVCQLPWERVKCDPGDYCPEGSQIRQTCAAGRVCRTPAENAPCPAGYFCPAGTWEPRRCSPLALCSEGSSTQRGWLALSLEFIILAAVLVIYFIVHRIRAKQRRARVEAAAKVKRVNNRFMQPVAESETDESSDASDIPLLSSRSSSSSSLQSSRNYHAPIAYERPQIDIEFKDLELKVSGGKKTVLQAVSGRFRPGQLSAVMGPSGAGKSSLLSVLSGEAKKSSGQILINGVEDKLSTYKSVIGFVPQEDIMHRTLSVIEILRFNAATRLPHDVSESEREELVHDILDVLNLKKVKYSLIGDETKRGLSGGERKRVNIGMELAADPSVLFLDEPTSGLDSSSAVQVVRCLKTIAARSNMTIICVIHQPRLDVFELFDSVLFLAPGGRTVFQGGVPGAESYFNFLGYELPRNANPADYYMDVISACNSGDPGSMDLEIKNLPDEWIKYKEEDADDVVEHISSSASHQLARFKPRRTAGFFTQLWLFLVRSCVLQMRDLRSIILNIFLVFISGMLLGFVYSDATYVGPASSEKQSACPEFIKELCNLPQEDTYVLQFALMNMALGLTAVAGALRTFGDERVTFWRESKTGSSLAFFVGKNLAGIPMVLIPPLFLVSIFYFLTAPAASFWQMYAVLLIVQFVCVAVGYVISLLLSPANALLAGVVFVVVSTMFSGANPTLAKLKTIGVPALAMASLSFSRWSTEALYSSLLSVYEHEYDVQPGLQHWGYDMANFPLVDILALLGLGFGLRIVAFLVLFFLHRNKSA